MQPRLFHNQSAGILYPDCVLQTESRGRWLTDSFTGIYTAHNCIQAVLKNKTIPVWSPYAGRKEKNNIYTSRSRLFF